MPKPKLNPHQAARERARTLALFSSIGDGIIATDEEGNISEVNSAAVRILGFHSEELLGQWFPRAIRAVDEDGEDINMLDRYVTQAMVTGKPIAGKTFYISKSRQRVPVAITVAPIMLEDRPVGAIEIFRDVTHEHEVDRMKSEFISIASHQLRTPLTAIKTYTHMLDGGFGGSLSSTQKEFVNIIQSSIERMNELINTLLDITKIEQGRLSVAPQVTDLKELIDTVMAELTAQAKLKDLTIKTKVAAKDARLNTDPLLVKEVLVNLLSNAIKYTPEGGQIKLEIDEDDKCFNFVIQDNGYGIPLKEQRRVFSKFFRAENIQDKSAGGTGLGLYLVKQVIDNLGGRITFQSQEGEGTTFRFSLPKS